MAPLWRTVQMAVIVSVAAGILGTGLAWLLVRTDVPFARLWRVLTPLPLVFPSFVGAAAFLAGLAPDGLLRNILELIGYHPPRRFRGLGASCLVLTLFTYPYVYLPVAARLAGLPPSLEESARLLGDSTARLFTRVVLPSIRSSVLGGMLIVLLYSLSEFGAVQLLGYDTLTRVIYSTRLLDRAQSFAAATLLLVLALVAVTIERRLRGPMRHGAPPAARRKRPIPIGRWRIPAAAAVAAVLLVALVAPLASPGPMGVARHQPGRFAGRQPRRLAGRARRTGMDDCLARRRRRHRGNPGRAPTGAARRPVPQPGERDDQCDHARRVRRARTGDRAESRVLGPQRAVRSIACTNPHRCSSRPTSSTSVRRPCDRARSPSPACPDGSPSRRSCSELHPSGGR